MSFSVSCGLRVSSTDILQSIYSLYTDITKCFFCCCFFLFFFGGGEERGVVVVVFLFFFLVPVNFARCWDLGELSSAAGVNTYHIMHSPCNTIPLSLSAAGRRLTM